MKKTFTILIAAIAAVMLITQTFTASGQTKGAVFTETFASCTGTMGWSGSGVANGDFYTDNQDWSVSYAYGAGGAARFGKSSNGKGEAETPSISYTGKATLTFKAGAWDANKESTTLKLSATNATLQINGSNITNVTLVKGQWSNYTVDIIPDENITSFKIKFEGNGASNSRFFLDDVVVTPKHTITYAVDPDATGSVSGKDVGNNTVANGAYITEGATVTLTAAASAAGYTFDHWGYIGTDASLPNPDTNPTTFTMGTANATVTAYFVQNATNYTTTIPTQTNGTITATPSSCTSGTSVKLHPTPSANYRFDGFTITKTEGGDDAGISPTGPDASGDYTFSMPAYNITVNGTFTRVYNVNFTVSDGATFVGNSAFPSTSNVKAAGTYTLPSATKTNYALEGWSDGSTLYAKGASYTVSGDVSFTAQWIPTTTHTFDFTSVNNFYTATTGSTHPTEGTKITEFYYGQDRIKFTADGTDNCKFSSYSTSYYFIFGKQNAYINLPSFEGYKIIQVVLHSSSGCSQSVGVKIVSGSNDVASSQTWSTQDANYTYDIPVAYQKSDLTVKIATNNNAQITSLSIVCVELPSYELTIESPSNGTFTVKDKNDNDISDGDDVKEGALVKLAATPDEGYVLEAFSVTKAGSGSVEVTMDGNNGTFNMPDGAVTVNATFVAKKTLTYKAKDGTGADVVEDHASGTNVELKDGSTIFTAPSPQHYFLYWTKNADGTGTQYSAGSEYELTENTTLYANWSNLYNVAVSSVENVVISASYGDSSTIAEGENANVEYGTTITLNHDLGAGKTFIWDVYKTSDSETKVTVKNNSFTVPAYGVTVSGEIKDVYTITFDVNGDTEAIAAVNVVEGNSIDLTANTYKPSLVGHTFKGWSETNGSATTIATPATYTPAASKTLYAVFTKVTGSDNFTLTKDSGFPSTYNSSGATITLAGHSFFVKDVGTSYNSDIQIKKSSGTIYNTASFGKITEIKLEGTYTNTVIYYGNSSNPNSETISPGTGDDAGKYDLSEIKPEYIKITSSSGASNLTSIKITYESSYDVIFINSACTKTGIAVGEIVYVGANGILTLTGANAGNASNLIIEEGGQLILSGGSKDGVQATFQREVEGYGSSTGKDKYILLANPTTGDIDPTTVAGMLDNNYDLYYFDEAQTGAEWRNYKQEPFDLENGKGYLYANSGNTTLNLEGTVPTATSKTGIELSYTEDNPFKGFNLIGNPFSVNITIMQINTTACPYYKLKDDGSFTPVNAANVASNPVIVGEAFMVQALSSGDKLHLNTGAKDEDAYNDEVIRIEVSNSKYTDVAYICYGNSMPLTKINHLNDDAPMIYIHTESDDRAIAVLNERSEVKTVNVNFEAKTMGSYTISAKAEKGNFSYMHLYDRLTGVDTDMLENDYTFIGAKEDAAGRFILSFEAIDNDSENDIFAYQNGNDIIINGEGELQIFDVMGRMVSTQRVNGREIVAVSSQGVYILRLIGAEIKTQKIVVR